MIGRGRARRVLAAAVSLSLLAGACSGGEDDADGGRPHRGLPCPDGSVLGCPVRAAALSIPVAGTGLELVYRSDRTSRESPAALGGWSLAGYDELDADAGTVLTGAGDRRSVAEVEGADGEVLVPSADGTTVAVFSDGVHERTVDAFTGIEVVRYGHRDGRLTEVTDRFGATTTIERDADGRPVAIVASGGIRTALHVDGDGLLVATNDPFGTGWSLAYADGAEGLLASATDGAGTGPAFTYDADGRLETSTDADGIETRWSGSESDDETTVVAATPSGATTTWTDRRDADERTITVERDGGDRVTEEITVDGSSTLVLADGTQLRRQREPDPRWEGSVTRVVAATVTTPGGRSTTVNELVDVTTGGDDPLMVVEALREVSTGGAVTSTTWDGAERLLSATNAAGVTTAVRLDARGHLAEVRRAGTPGVRIERDDGGRPTAIDAGRGTSRISYPDGPEAVVTDPLGQEWRAAVDSAGNLASILGPDGRRIIVERNASGLPVAFSVDGAQVHGAAWTPAGRPAGRSGPYDETVRHDEDGRATTVMAGGGQTILGYDERGDLESFDTGSDTFAFEHEPTSERSTSNASGLEHVVERDGPVVDRVTTTGPVEGVVAYEYDDALQLASLAIAGTEVAIDRETSGRITGVGDLVLEWDDAGRLAETSFGRVTSVRRHDELGDLEAEEWRVADAARLTLSVVRDALGRATSETTSGPAGTITTAFTYDPAGRVAGAVQAPATWGFEWDRHDNLASIIRPSGREDLTYDGRDRLTQRGATSYRWRDDGALVGWTDAAGATALHVDARGRTTGADLPDGRAITYLLDAAGRRAAREVDGTFQQGYLYDHGDAPVALIGADGDVTQRYVRTDTEAPAFILAGDATYRVVSDRRGSPRAVIDVATGEVLQELDYDPLGRITRDTNPGFQPFGFGGGLVDPDTGLVQLGAREYEPATGRFTTPDPAFLAGGQINPYVFGDGDPVNLVDPRGLQASPAANGEPNGDPSGAFPDLQGFVDTVLNPGPPSQGLVQLGGATLGLSGLEPEVNKPLEGIGKAGGNLELAGKLGLVDLAGAHGLRGYATELKVVGQIAPQGLGAVSGALGLARLVRDGVTADSSPRNVIDTVTDTMEGLELVSPYAAEGFGHLFTVYVFGKLVPEAFEGTGEAGGSHGDPHLATIDGLHYDFQGAGEYVLLRSEDGAAEVQVRQQPVRGMRTVTVNTAVAVRVGASRVTVGPDGAVLVDGEAAAIDAGALPLDGGSVRRDARGEVIVVAEGAMVIGITRYESHLDVRVAVDPALAGKVAGLLGDADGDPANDLATADGQLVEPDDAVDATAADPLHAVFGESWRVTSGTTLFPYAPGTDTGTFTDRSIPAEGSGVDALDADARAAAEAICRGAGVLKQPFLDDCTIDVALTGDPALATSASRSQRSAASGGGAVRVRPEDMTDEAGGAVHLGEDVEGDLEVGQRRTYTFEADAGDFVYLASLSGPCEVEVHVIAPDGESLSRSGACLDTGRIELSGDGAYEVAVSASTIAGEYGFVLLESGPDERRELRVGDEVEGTIELSGVRHVYALDAEPGRALLIVGRAATCDVSIRPHDADGDSFGAPGGLCGDLRFDVPADGRAQLIVTAFEEKTAPYAFRLDPVPP